MIQSQSRLTVNGTVLMATHMKRFLLSLTLIACADEVQPSCEDQACSYVSECSRLTAGEWDWRTEGACLSTFSCGIYSDICLDAILSLPCLGDNPTLDEVEDHTWAMVYVRHNCLN